jgi:hypothetical protein
MLQCPNCGSSNVPTAQACRTCGVRLEDRAKKGGYGAVASGESRITTKSASVSSLIRCPSCKAYNEPDYTFCPLCGAELVSEEVIDDLKNTRITTPPSAGAPAQSVVQPSPPPFQAPPAQKSSPQPVPVAPAPPAQKSSPQPVPATPAPPAQSSPPRSAPTEKAAPKDIAPPAGVVGQPQRPVAKPVVIPTPPASAGKSGSGGQSAVSKSDPGGQSVPVKPDPVRASVPGKPGSSDQGTLGQSGAAQSPPSSNKAPSGGEVSAAQPPSPRPLSAPVQPANAAPIPKGPSVKPPVGAGGEKEKLPSAPANPANVSEKPAPVAEKPKGLSMPSTPQPPSPGASASAPVICPKCTHENKAGLDFCEKCGEQISFSQTLIMTLPPPPKGRLRLIVDGLERGQPFELNEDNAIGRTGGDITFPADGYMSGNHARIIQRGGDFILTDVGSRNGTFVKIKSEVQLEPGDIIMIGRQFFRFET